MNQLARYIIGAVATAVVVFLIWYFSNIVGYILVSAVLAVMGHPLMTILNRVQIGKFSMPKWLQALITLLVILGASVLFFALFIPLITSKLSLLSQVDFSEITMIFQEPLDKFQKFLQQYFSLETSGMEINAMVEKQLSSMVDVGRINNFFSSIVTIVIDAGIALFSIIFITFFFLKEDNLFTSMVLGAFPAKYEGNIERALKSITYLLSRYFVGIVAESIIMMLIISLGLLCFGFSISEAFFVGLIVGVLNVIPYAGPFMGTIISLCLGIISPIAGMGIGGTLCVIAGAVAVSTAIDNFILQPVIYSSRVKAHPLEIFIVILMSGYVAGIVGMLLAIPSYTVIRVFAKEFFSQFSLVRRLTDKI